MSTYGDVLTFWFEEIEAKQWWIKDPEFDREITSRFSALHSLATRCELYEWRSSAAGRLAEIILLDQFSRNIYRDSPLAFSSDPLALVLAQEAVANGSDLELPVAHRNFIYMPYMHSESLKMHEIVVELFENNHAQANLNSEIRHKAIIEKFGRYPHRNEILGRTSSAEELEFLKQPGSSF